MKYKFINEYTIEPYKKGFVILDNKIYTNPTEEVLLKAGFKDLKDDEAEPEYNPETQYLEIMYVEKDNEIVKIYKVKDIETVEENEILETVEEDKEATNEEGEKS